jgi:hypothetical protein
VEVYFGDLSCSHAILESQARQFMLLDTVGGEILDMMLQRLKVSCMVNNLFLLPVMFQLLTLNRGACCLLDTYCSEERL